jgi:hypothetical protein
MNDGIINTNKLDCEEEQNLFCCCCKYFCSETIFNVINEHINNRKVQLIEFWMRDRVWKRK